jgi:hypothetical protein
MMRRWGHQHSLGAGLLFGLLLSRRPELIFGAGVLVGLGFVYLRHSAAWMKELVSNYARRKTDRKGWGKAGPVNTEPVPVYRVPTQTTKIPY